MKLAFEFTKTGNLIYISHLDLARLFLRVLRMSGLRPAYSHGFNPHPKMSFALPLSLGLHSTCELLEFEIADERGALDLNLAARTVNERLPEGARVTAWLARRGDASKSLASRAAAAKYEFMCGGVGDAPALLEAFFAMERVTVGKRDKKTGGEIEKDIRPEMLGYGIVKAAPGHMLAEASLAAAPGKTLNPLLFFKAFCEKMELDAALSAPVITRTAILGADGRSLTAERRDDWITL